MSALNAKGVEYLVIGGWAVSYHAEPRATKDLDILIKAELKNAEALHHALKDVGVPVETLKSRDLIIPGSFDRMGAPPNMVDILPEAKGVDFDEAWRRRVTFVPDTATGLEAHFISSDDLIKSKKAAGCAQDTADVKALTKAKTASKPNSKSRLKKTLPTVPPVEPDG